MKKRIKAVIISVIALVLVAAIGIGVYLGDYYRADSTAAVALTGSQTVSVKTEGHGEEIDGLVLLASYSTADLSQTDLSVLSVYASKPSKTPKIIIPSIITATAIYCLGGSFSFKNILESIIETML